MSGNNPLKPEEPDLHERLLMAILAPIFFNLSILIVLWTFFRRSIDLAKLLVYQTHWSYISFFLIAVVLPALVGFRLGAEKCAVLLGHLFCTNMEHERNLIKTLLAWGAIFFFAYLVAQVI